jgi:hypothetical protein
MGMNTVTARAGTGLSPEWDRWFDEEFTDLITSDQELLRTEFDDLIASSWPQPPSPPAPAAPPGTNPEEESATPSEQAGPLAGPDHQAPLLTRPPPE